MSDPRTELLSLTRIGKSFAGVHALRDVSLALRKGEVSCLVGENGSGKSTLIKILGGVLEPDSGEIVIEGRACVRLRPIDAIREGIAVIYQDFALFPNLTVAENLAFAEELFRSRRLVRWRGVYDTAAAALERIGLDLHPSALVRELPTGTRQLIAIARALIQDARLVVMDEPTAALGRKDVDRLLSTIRRLSCAGISVLFVSHKLDEVLAVADRILVIRNGSLVADGPAGAFDRASIVRHMTGREISVGDAGPRPSPGPVLLKADRLSCGTRFRNVSFELRAGEILGFSGLLGSGRSSLALSLFGVLPSDSGTVWIGGRPARIRSVEEAIRHRIGYVPADRLREGLFLEQPIGRNLVVRAIGRLRNRAGLIDSAAVEREISRWLENLSIRTPTAALPVSSLSGGNQQRVVLGRWLAADPKILILNNPTAGVDVSSKADIHSRIRALVAAGMGIIAVSDDVPELLHLCDRIVLMRKGETVQEFLRHEIDEARLDTLLATA